MCVGLFVSSPLAGLSGKSGSFEVGWVNQLFCAPLLSLAGRERSFVGLWLEQETFRSGWTSQPGRCVW